MTVFEEKVPVKDKVSLGLLLEYHKATWPLMCVVCWYTSPCVDGVRMSLMTGMFSAYGILWILKSSTFYDKKLYSQYDSMKQSVINYLSISVYYLFPWIASRNCFEISEFDICTSILCYAVGSFLHYSADAQKFYTLKYKPNVLVYEDLFGYLQHPNYTGEFLIWFALAIVSNKFSVLSYVPIAWLYLITVLVGIPQKRNSMKRFPNYDEWSKNTYQLIPFVW